MSKLDGIESFEEIAYYYYKVKKRNPEESVERALCYILEYGTELEKHKFLGLENLLESITLYKKLENREYDLFYEVIDMIYPEVKDSSIYSKQRIIDEALEHDECREGIRAVMVAEKMRSNFPISKLELYIKEIEGDSE